MYLVNGWKLKRWSFFFLVFVLAFTEQWLSYRKIIQRKNDSVDNIIKKVKNEYTADTYEFPTGGNITSFVGSDGIVNKNAKRVRVSLTTLEWEWLT